MKYLRIAEYRELVERQRDERIALRKRLRNEHEKARIPEAVRLQEINKRATERSLLAASLRLYGCMTYEKIGQFMGGVSAHRGAQLVHKGFRTARIIGATI